MRPSILSEEILRDPFRGAERRFFEAATALPSSWTVLYGVPWVSRGLGAGNREGEADFVIIGPDVGLVVVEIKGGRVGCDDRGWYTVDRHERRHPIKNPFEQSQRSKHQILAYLKEQPGLGNLWLPLSHAVCFPDVLSRDIPRLPEGPPELAIGHEDIGNLAKALRKASTLFNEDPRLEAHVCSRIADCLKPSFHMPGRWSVVAKQQREILDRLTAEQSDILSAIEGHPRIGLTGPAGSGKTLIAARWARDQIRNNEQVLVSVPGTLLVEYYQTLLPEAKASDIVPHNMIKQLVGASWTRVVIDEAQDLSLEAWDYIESSLACDTSRQLVVVYDENQRLRQKDSFYLPDRLFSARLPRIIRNTQQIARLSTRFFRDGGARRPLIDGPEGPDVISVQSNDPRNVGNEVAKLVLRLVNEEGFEYKDIVVLHAHGRGADIRKGGVQFKGISFRAIGLVWRDASKHPMVACGSVGSFLGMESPVVILADIDGALDNDLVEACYVGASRARCVLGLVASQETLGRVSSLSDG
ncbi:MAG: NERD domain-containing protein [Planctomycetes bacterium]|nr:NERD domain-containing protein [Planctomycetota bacterium]